MAVKNRFIIRRKDNDRGVDDVVLESEGLTIGRLKGNDLVMNHRAVSRTHAGIKQIGSDFWLFNLSASNGTLLNGELVDKGPLADGDLIQIGPYLLQIKYLPNALSIEIERELEVLPLEARSSSPLGGDATQMIKIPAAALKQVLTPGGTARPQGTGYLTSMLPALDQRALDVFWDKRKREAGKIDAKTPLHPHASKKLGKSQFNWSPTLDLRKLWRKSYFSWGVVVVAAFSVAALFLYQGAYSPGEISDPHSSPQVGGKGIALAANENSCSSCHGIGASIQDNCVSCHTTPKFQPVIYEKHQRESVGCTSCHAEHQGPSIGAGLISYGLCSNCHNDSYRVKTGERAGSVLGVPHGGSVGYPVEDRKWVWPGLSAERWKKKDLPESWAKYSLKEQFHAVHQKGRLQGKTLCADCHSTGSRGEERWRVSPRNECAKCHSVTYSSTGLRRGTANCNTCHQQHGRSDDVARLVPPAGKDTVKVKKFIESLEAGPQLNEDINGQELAPNAKSALVVTGGDARARRQNRTTIAFGFIRNFGALPWYAWLGLVAVLPVAAVLAMAASTSRRKHWLKRFKIQTRAEKIPTGSIDLEKVKAEGPPYPHPVIDPVLCIGCHACVEACPHDVLTIVNGIANPAALDQCMEDTSCQVECPTNPKACIVINTNKVIPPRKVPARDQRLMTNIDGVYMIGDVSGVPLIKNAVNEGAQVVDCIIEDLGGEGAASNAQYDVAIVGVGPAGLSAAVIARQRGLSYVAIEQDKVVSTIQNYPAGKYIFYKPDTAEAKGGVPMPGAGEKKEALLQSWINTMTSSGVEVQEEESCTSVKREGSHFVVSTEKGKLKQKTSYHVRRVILAIGNRGTPMKLRVSGEEIKMLVQPEPAHAKHCPKCGTSRREGQPFCPKCGTPLPLKTLAPYEDAKVKYKLTDPDDYVGKKCIIVGAGNSAIEAACDLAGFKRDGDSFTFSRTNEVTLVIRSDFKGDLKLGNKMNVYDCMDAGKIKVHFRTEIKEITEREVVLMDVRSKEEKARIANDYVFAMIGGERPTKFLENIGIKIG